MATRKITPDVVAKLQMVLNDCGGNVSELGRRMGIHQSYLTRYLNGTVKAVQEDMWQKMCAYIPEIDDRPSVNIDTEQVVKNYRSSVMRAVINNERISLAAKTEIYTILDNLPLIQDSPRHNPPAAIRVDWIHHNSEKPDMPAAIASTASTIDSFVSAIKKASAVTVDPAVSVAYPANLKDALKVHHVGTDIAVEKKNQNRVMREMLNRKKDKTGSAE